MMETEGAEGVENWVREGVRESLILEQLENLGEALLDFNSMSDLQAWLDGNG